LFFFFFFFLFFFFFARSRPNFFGFAELRQHNMDDELYK
jgi:hypothetical protein